MQDKPWKTGLKCIREGCPYMRSTLYDLRYCCWECKNGTDRSRTHDVWCDRLRPRTHWESKSNGAEKRGLDHGIANLSSANDDVGPMTVEERVEAIMIGLERSEAVLKTSLAYSVVRNDPRYPPHVCVREAPDARAQEVARLPHGRIVHGYPSLGWLRLDANNGTLEGQWVFIGRQLAACCLNITVRVQRQDGLELEWPGLTDALAAYSIDWEVGPTGTRRSMRCTEPCISITGLPPASLVKLRVLALLPDLDSISTGYRPVRVFGPWVETATAEAVAPEVAEEGNVTEEACDAVSLQCRPCEPAGLITSISDVEPKGKDDDLQATEEPTTPPNSQGDDASGDESSHTETSPKSQPAGVVQQESEAVDQMEESSQFVNRKFSVRDLVKAFEGKWRANVS